MARGHGRAKKKRDGGGAGESTAGLRAPLFGVSFGRIFTALKGRIGPS